MDNEANLKSVKTLSTRAIPVIEDVRLRGKSWDELAQKYGVLNPEPPWKVDLEATCDLLAEEASEPSANIHELGTTCALPALERRAEEDVLSETIYADVPYPERQLLALAHSLLRRGLFSEADLAAKMIAVARKLNEN
jgi:hypothetical protein